MTGSLLLETPPEIAAPPGGRRTRRWVRRLTNPGLVLVLVLTVLVVYPIALLLYSSFSTAAPGSGGSFTLSGFTAAFNAGSEAIIDTVVVAAVSTGLGLVLALGLAWIVSRTDTPFARAFEVLIILPYFIPGLLTAMAWGLLASPRGGLLNEAWTWLTGSTKPLINIYSLGGISWHMMQHATPFLFMMILPALRNVNVSLEEASRVLGGSPWRTWFRVTMPVLLPVIGGAAILSFTRGIEAFEGALIFGTPANIKMLTTQVYTAIYGNTQADYTFASATAIILVAVLIVPIALQMRMVGQRSFVTVSGQGHRASKVKLGKLKWVTFALCCLYVLVMLVLPAGQLILGSLSPRLGEYGSFTLAHYKEVLGDPALWQSFGTTMWLAGGASFLAVALALAIGYYTVRVRSRLSRLVDLLAWLPWLVPGIVLALGLLWAFALLPPQFALYGSIWTLLFAYIAMRLPLACRIMSGAVHQIGVELEESGRVHGLRKWRVVFRILLPLILPSCILAFMLAFFSLLFDVGATILLYTPTQRPLGIYTLDLWTNGYIEQVAVVATLAVVLVGIFKGIEAWMLRQWRHLMK